MEINIYIANLGKYNDGELVGAWFTAPVNIEDVIEKIELNSENEEYAIHDYESPINIDINEHSTIEDINKLAEQLEELEGTSLYNSINDLIGDWFNNLEELIEHKDDIICYGDCSSMEDVARYYIEETGMFGEIPSHLLNYIDYAAYGRDLEISGNFLITSNGVFELCN